MRLNSRLTFAVKFANFCWNHQIAPKLLAELIEVAERSTRAYVRELDAQDGNKTAKLQAEVERRAGELGFGVEWNSCWPTLTRNGQDVYLPEPS